jgi:hypothetical protein
MIRLWHDDVRPAPEGWVWARTNDEAKEILATGKVSHISLDHDMGNHDLPAGTYDGGPNSGSGMPQKGEENGMHLVEWMIENSHLPGWIRVHAWNPSGRERMCHALNDAGANTVSQSYRQGEVLAV